MSLKSIYINEKEAFGSFHLHKLFLPMNFSLNKLNKINILLS
jgi:hypothetical protein